MNQTTAAFWLLRASGQAAVLVMIVLLTQWLFKKSLNARWRYALWLLVVARLLLPATPQSALSLFNFARIDRTFIRAKTSMVPAPTVRASVVPELSVQPLVVASPAPSSGFETHVAPAALPAPLINRQDSHVASFQWRNLLPVFAIIWAIGAVLLSLRVAFQTVVFVRALRGVKPVTDIAALELFEECKSIIRVRAPVRLVETEQVRSPALYGLFRPCLLLPAGMIDGFSAQELRCIFLHELAHVKRRDMAVHWAVTLLRILHWFNPILWFGFRHMAADRELACDELAPMDL